MTSWRKALNRALAAPAVTKLVVVLLCVVLLQGLRIYFMERQQLAGDREVLSTIQSRRVVRDEQFQQISHQLQVISQRLDALEGKR